MARVYVTRKIPDSGLKLLVGNDLVVGEQAPPARAQLLENVAGVDAILSILTEKIDQEVIDTAGPNLKVIANYAVGYDNIDVKYAHSKGIIITNTPGVLTQAVAEHTWALIMAVARRVVESDKFLRAGQYKAWGPDLLVGHQLKGKTLGVWGMGRIGYEVGRIGSQGFGMKVLYNDVVTNENAEKDFMAAKVDVPTLFEQSDIVSIHVNLTPENHHLVNADLMKKMKPTAILINTSRGPIVDEVALVEALKSQTIAGAGLDVFENEPNLSPGMAELDNIVITPHTASASREARDDMARLAAQGILDVLAGRIPKNIVTLSA